MSKPNEKASVTCTLHPQFSTHSFSLFVLGVSLVLAMIHALLTDAYFFGAWNVIFYLLLITPLVWLLYRKKLDNSYTKRLIPFTLIWLFDIFYFNNNFVQHILPVILFCFIIVLYLTGMHKVDAFYQTLLPTLHIPLKGSTCLKTFMKTLFIPQKHKTLYQRIGIALLLTLPVLTVFTLLFMSADTRFDRFVSSLFTWNLSFKSSDLILIPLYALIYLLIFIFGLSNAAHRTVTASQQRFDPLIMTIFLGLLNLLFITFLLFQIKYLFGGKSYLIETGINIADFAREGFFQLAWVMGLVLTIFLFLMKRFHGEKYIAWLMGGLIVQTVVLGISSLKKMYLYQSVMGYTVLRYYVAWFDYFLIFILIAGLYFIFTRKPFKTVLNTTFFAGILSFTVIVSLNIDYMVAKNNIEKFGINTQKLDKKALSHLSIDALPALAGTDIVLNLHRPRDCTAMRQYHTGYCKLLSRNNSMQNIAFIPEK